MGCRFPCSHEGGTWECTLFADHSCLSRYDYKEWHRYISDLNRYFFSAFKLKGPFNFIYPIITQRMAQGGRGGKRLSKLAVQGEDKTIPCKHCLCGDIFKVSLSPLFLKRLSSEIQPRPHNSAAMCAGRERRISKSAVSCSSSQTLISDAWLAR